MEFDRVVQERPSLISVQDEQVITLQREWRRLRRLQLLANYVDYFKASLDHLRHLTQNQEEKQEEVAEDILRGHWEDILDCFRKGLAHFKSPDSDKDYTSREYAVWRMIEGLAKDMNLTQEYIQKCIELYVERSNAVHRDMKHMLREQKFDSLAQMLGNDRVNLRTVIGVVSEDERHALLAILDSIIERWFKAPPGGYDNPDSWSATEIALGLSDELCAKRSKRSVKIAKEASEAKPAEEAQARRKQAAGKNVSVEQMYEGCEIMLIERRIQLQDAIRKYEQKARELQRWSHGVGRSLQELANEITATAALASDSPGHSVSLHRVDDRLAVMIAEQHKTSQLMAAQVRGMQENIRAWRAMLEHLRVSKNPADNEMYRRAAGIAPATSPTEEHGSQIYTHATRQG